MTLKWLIAVFLVMTSTVISIQEARAGGLVLFENKLKPQQQNLFTKHCENVLLAIEIDIFGGEMGDVVDNGSEGSKKIQKQEKSIERPRLPEVEKQIIPVVPDKKERKETPLKPSKPQKPSYGPN